jgi:hypothetical protein
LLFTDLLVIDPEVALTSTLVLVRMAASALEPDLAYFVLMVPQVMEDTTLDGLSSQVDCIFDAEVFFKL